MAEGGSSKVEVDPQLVSPRMITFVDCCRDSWRGLTAENRMATKWLSVYLGAGQNVVAEAKQSSNASDDAVRTSDGAAPIEGLNVLSEHCEGN